MIVLVVVFVAVVLLTIGLGVLGYHKGRLPGGGPAAWGEAAAARLGAFPAAIVVAVVGYVATAAVGLGLGFLAKAAQSSIDEPVYNWIFPQVDDNFFSRAQNKLTLMGNNPITQVVALIAVIALVFAYKRRWYIPVLGVLVAYEGEHYMQKALAKIVDRGHPGLSFPAPGGADAVPTFGTYPSGGVGRILSVYGAIVILVILIQPRLSRSWRAGLWTGLTLMAVVESFSRIYLSKHWLTDAVFGLPFGALLLLSNVAAISALGWRRHDDADDNVATSSRDVPSGPAEEPLAI